MQVRTPAEEDVWDNRANCAVPYWSKENIWEAAGEGILQSRDLTPDFKPNLQGTAGNAGNAVNAVKTAKTRFGTQDAPFPGASKPNLRVPLGPRPSNGGRCGGGPVTASAAPHFNVATSTLRAEVAHQEAETAALNAKLARTERELALVRKVLHGFIDLHMIYHNRGQI